MTRFPVRRVEEAARMHFAVLFVGPDVDYQLALYNHATRVSGPRRTASADGTTGLLTTATSS